jgi:hypothetical protein
MLRSLHSILLVDDSVFDTDPASGGVSPDPVAA